MPTAALAFRFDPFVRFGDGGLRMETLAIAVAILLAIVTAARIATLTPRSSHVGANAGNLRIDDLVFIVLGIVPGAIVFARLGYVAIHLDYYAANPADILDTTQGSLELTLGVLGGVATGCVAARLLREPVRRWLHVAALPLLVGLTLGKVALAFGGSGQGAPTDVPWATSYAGAGPWGSLAAAIPSHPSQLYEAAATALVLVLLVLASSAGSFRSRDGTAFVAAVAGWAVARAIVAATWRDAPIAGPLNAEQLLCLVIVAASAPAFVALGRRRARAIRPAGREPVEARAEQPL